VGAFSSPHHGSNVILQPLRLMPGVCDASDHMQWVTNTIFVNHDPSGDNPEARPDPNLAGYADNLIGGANDFEGYLRLVRRVFEDARAAGVSFAPEQPVFSCSVTHVLGVLAGGAASWPCLSDWRHWPMRRRPPAATASHCSSSPPPA